MTQYLVTYHYRKGRFKVNQKMYTCYGKENIILTISEIMSDNEAYIPDMIQDDVRQELYLHFFQRDWKVNEQVITEEQIWGIVQDVCSKSCGSAHLIPMTGYLDEVNVE